MVQDHLLLKYTDICWTYFSVNKCTNSNEQNRSSHKELNLVMVWCHRKSEDNQSQKDTSAENHKYLHKHQSQVISQYCLCQPVSTLAGLHQGGNNDC